MRNEDGNHARVARLRWLLPVPRLFICVLTGGFPYTVVRLVLVTVVARRAGAGKTLGAGARSGRWSLGWIFGLGLSAPAWLSLLEYDPRVRAVRRARGWATSRGPCRPKRAAGSGPAELDGVRWNDFANHPVAPTPRSNSPVASCPMAALLAVFVCARRRAHLARPAVGPISYSDSVLRALHGAESGDVPVEFSLAAAFSPRARADRARARLHTAGLVPRHAFPARKSRSLWVTRPDRRGHGFSMVAAWHTPSDQRNHPAPSACGRLLVAAGVARVSRRCTRVAGVVMGDVFTGADNVFGVAMDHDYRHACTPTRACQNTAFGPSLANVSPLFRRTVST